MTGMPFNTATIRAVVKEYAVLCSQPDASDQTRTQTACVRKTCVNSDQQCVG